MRMLRLLLAPAATIAFAFTFAVNADAQTKLTIGKVIGGDGFHIPTYVAMDEGFFKAEGLDASLVELQARSQVTAVLSGNLDCAPIPSGGAQAALSGAKIMYIVGESLKSQWTITTRQEINKPEDLKGKTLGYGRAGGADYDEAAGGAAPLLSHGRRQGLQGHLVPGRARAHCRHGQRRYPGCVALDPARRRGRAMPD